MTNKRIYLFADKENCDWKGAYDAAKQMLGGKGAGLVEMMKAGLPVPPGFTITTTTCNEYLGCPESERHDFIKQLMVEVLEYDKRLLDVYGTVSCKVPYIYGMLLSSQSKEALWDKYYMATPPRRRQFVEQYKIVKRA